MAWRIRIERDAEKDLDRLGSVAAKRILRFIHERVAQLDDPRSIGEALKGPRFGEHWKYRLGDYRIVANIEDGTVTILVLRIGDRKDVYRR